MLVSDLIKLLEQEDQNAVVLLSSDEEGNNFSKLACGYGTATTKEEKDMLDSCTYGLNPEDIDKNWLILYPEM